MKKTIKGKERDINMPDLFLVSGALESLKENIKRLDKAIMGEVNECDINWERAAELAYTITENAEMILEEVDYD